MIAVDNTFLTLMLHPSARPPIDPSTGARVSRVDERIDLLTATWDKDRETIIIPAPVLSEFLILAGNDGPTFLTEIDRRRNFHIEAFDTRAAIELATVELAIKAGGADKRDGAPGTWAKIKFDRQIVAIAKVNGATKIYSDDEGADRFARRCGIEVVKTWELPLPPEKHPLLAGLEGGGVDGIIERQAIVVVNGNEEESTVREKESTESAVTGVPKIPRLSAPLGLYPKQEVDKEKEKERRGKVER